VTSGIGTSFPPSSGPRKRGMNGHNPTGATCTVKSTYALIIKIQNLRIRKMEPIVAPTRACPP